MMGFLLLVIHMMNEIHALKLFPDLKVVEMELEEDDDDVSFICL